MTSEERAELGAQYKAQMNCCQAVVRAFADTVDLDEETLRSIASGFGSGIGTMEGTCGALVGAVMIFGLRTDGKSGRLSREILTRFKARCGAVTCRELKGAGTGIALCSCVDCVRNAILALDEVLANIVSSH